MSKETLYFRHDCNSRTDRKLVNLIIKHGMIGIGVYWCIVEMLYEEGGYLPQEYERISFELHSDYDIVKSVIHDFQLFNLDDEKFWSERILEELKERCEKSDKARESIQKRWDKYKRNTNVIQSNMGRNTKEKSIVEKRREEKSKEKEKSKPDKPADFIDQIINEFVQAHGDYIIVNRGKERAAAGKLSSIYKERCPEADTEETLKALRQYFNGCIKIEDPWLRDNMSLSLIISKFNEINKILKNGKSKGIGVTDAELAELIANKRGVDSPGRED